MNAVFASDEWISTLAAKLRIDHVFRMAAKTWAHGPVLLVFEDAPAATGTQPTAICVDIHAGEARNVTCVHNPAIERYPFVIGGPVTRWQSVFDGEFTPVAAVQSSRMWHRGDLPAMVLHADIFTAIARAAGRIDTSWNEEIPTPETTSAGI